MALEHEALTERTIGAAIEVHRCLERGFLLNFAKATLEPRRVVGFLWRCLFLFRCLIARR